MRRRASVRNYLFIRTKPQRPPVRVAIKREAEMKERACEWWHIHAPNVAEARALLARWPYATTTQTARVVRHREFAEAT